MRRAWIAAVSVIAFATAGCGDGTVNAAKAEFETERQKVAAAKQKRDAAIALAEAYQRNPIQGLIEVVRALPKDSQPIVTLGGEAPGINLGRAAP